MRKDQASKEQFEKLGNDAVEYVPPEVVSEEDLVDAVGGETGGPYGTFVMVINTNSIPNTNAVVDVNMDVAVFPNYSINPTVCVNANEK